MKVAPTDNIHCIACRLPQAELKILVALPGEVGNIYICDECVGVLVGIVAEANPDWRAKQIDRLQSPDSN